MLVPRIIVHAALAAAALVAVGCAQDKDIRDAKPAGMPEGAEYFSGPGYSGYSDPDIRVVASYLSPEALDMYFSRFQGGRYSNPVPPVSFMAFSVEMDNRGGSMVTFDPRMTFFVNNAGDPYPPRDYAGFYTDLSLADSGDLEDRMDAFRSAFYDTSETIRPGERVHRLMVFSRAKDVSGGGMFTFNGIYVGHKTRAVKLQYAEDVGLTEQE